MTSMVAGPPPRSVPIIALTVLVTVGAVFTCILTWVNIDRATRALADILLAEIGGRAVVDSNRLFGDNGPILAVLHNAIESEPADQLRGPAAPDSAVERQRVQWMVTMLRQNGDLRSIGFGDRWGNYIEVDPVEVGRAVRISFVGGARNQCFLMDEGGRLTPTESPWVAGFDPRVRPWYQLAVQTGHLCWTPPYEFLPDHHLGVSGAMPVHDPSGAVYGVVSLSRGLAALAAFEVAHASEIGGNIFIVGDDGSLITLPPAATLRSSAPRAADSDDARIATAVRRMGELGWPGHPVGAFDVTVDAQTWRCLAQPFPAEQQPWTVVVQVPSARLMHAAETSQRVTLGVNAALVLLILGYVVFLNRSRHELTEARDVGSYHLDTLLAKGGMGAVWRAHHHLLKRPAAIKTILTGNDNPERAGAGLVRFDREVRATASLRSPHTVSCYDYGADEDGNAYFVMELLEGIDLYQLVKRFGALPEGRVIHLIAQACRSLEEAHAAALIHRDIKPSNIFLCRLGLETDFIKVLDFGLVKEEGPQRQARLTARDLVMGTVGFMAPEQITGDVVEPRSDIYALGCVAYWLLTGVDVFEAARPLDVLSRHTREEPQPPSVRLHRMLSPQLEALVLRCLRKAPESRPSARELRLSLLAIDDCPRWSAADANAWWAAHLPPS